jgi:oligoendopeptidase F
VSTSISILASVTVALMITMSTPGTRAEPPVKWDLSEIYASDEAWKEGLEELRGQVSSLDAFKGRLGTDAATLRQVLDLDFAMSMQAQRLGAYAGMRGDEDTREAGPQGMRQSLQSAAADLTAATAWVQPEILTIPSDVIARFLEEDPGLAVYRRYLEQLEKQRPHVLDAEGEELLGQARRVRGVGMTVGNLLRNAEMPWPTVKLSDGSELVVNSQGYRKGRVSQNRDDRIVTYEAYYKELQAFKAIDPAVYRMLVDEVNVSLPTHHRYLKLRAQILGLDDLRYHDMYVALVDEVDADYTWESSKKLAAEALAPLGKDYVKRLQKALDGGWIDVYPQPGKRSGAYVNDGAYEVHPYMLLNHQDDYSSASTMVHEAGHLMHSWYSQEAQPYPTAGYAIFVAEVASTVNQVMFFKHLIAEAPNDEVRLSLLGRFLEEMRTTVFRQVMFAEFELAMHEMAERGEPLTGDSLTAVYGDLLKRYHGDEQGVMKIDDLYAVEWASVPHFHYDFYVYQYATSYVASVALVEAILEDRPGALDRYRAFLKSGSTKPPVELLQDAGVDMTSPEPIRASMRAMNQVMDQIEEILARRR